MPEVECSKEQITKILAEVFPRAGELTFDWEIVSVDYAHAKVVLKFDDSLLRPGGTISGPAIMSIVDLALYVALMATLGPIVQAVTTNLSINFLARSEPSNLLVDASLIKIGKQLVVGDVRVCSENNGKLIAQANGTYSLPPKK